VADFEELSSYLYIAEQVMSVATPTSGCCTDDPTCVALWWDMLEVRGCTWLDHTDVEGWWGGLLCSEEEEEEDSTQQHRTSGQVEGASCKLVVDIGASSASIDGYHVSLVSGDMYQEICKVKGQIYVVLQNRSLFLDCEELAEKIRLH